ncbi:MULTISPECIES: hypothetical protein [Dyadobacter]|jgi:hypothetical protein|uniref:Uncharacterized protein n=1 Tax=Dyadobacter psychrotolerans TaxID=2541721 RepID=A0A4V6PFR2_9BACT|nr:hypothetical protein [Dyadobacter psychrotolerans]TDE13208.1 hypothetical protein E0F88_19335 [Dyadobacter psychrotolerans]
MQHPYSLEWYDLLVCITLNPAKTDVTAITEAQADSILKRADEEKEKIKVQLKREVYALRNHTQIKLLVRRYHSDLIILLDQACENNNQIPAGAQELKVLSGVIQEQLDELLSFIEGRYLKFLGLDEWIPTTYLHMTREELKIRVDQLKAKIGRKISDKKLIDIVFDTLYKFTSEEKGRRVTFREVVYKKELVRGLEEIASYKGEKALYNAIIELLIYRNFNKKAYLNYYTEKIAGRINSFVSVTDKLDQLLLAYKEFNQMHLKPGVRLNPNYKGVKNVVGNWFAQEINYLEKKFQWDVSPLEVKKLPERTKPADLKIRLSLNSDQIAILLRAFVYTGILERGSVHAVFKALIPLLSSTERDDLSWDSVRKRSYATEDKDKKAVIVMMEKTIAAIKKIDMI